jgi:hypothetical protein
MRDASQIERRVKRTTPTSFVLRLCSLLQSIRVVGFWTLLPNVLAWLGIVRNLHDSTGFSKPFLSFFWYHTILWAYVRYCWTDFFHSFENDATHGACLSSPGWYVRVKTCCTNFYQILRECSIGDIATQFIFSEKR